MPKTDDKIVHMLNDIYIYENRDLIYLKLYERKARLKVI